MLLVQGYVIALHKSQSRAFAGLWVWLTLLPTLIVNSKRDDKELCTRDYVGWGVWLAGMLVECVADYQKYVFRSNSANKYDKKLSF